MRPKVVVLILVMFLLPLIVPAANNPVSIINNASAADACEGDIEPVSWNQSLQRIAMVPHFNPYESWWDIFDEGPGNGKERDGNSNSNGQEDSVDMSLSPEPEWMYYAPWEQEDLTLDPFVSNHHATLLIGNDSVGALKLNLSANHRTTICITLQDFDQVNDPYKNFDDVKELNKLKKLMYEKEAIGFFMTGHPVENYYRNDFSCLETHIINDLKPDTKKAST